MRVRLFYTRTYECKALLQKSLVSGGGHPPFVNFFAVRVKFFHTSAICVYGVANMNRLLKIIVLFCRI